MKRTLEYITIRGTVEELSADLDWTVGKLKEKYNISSEIGIRKDTEREVRILQDTVYIKDLPSKRIYEAVGVVGGYR